MVRKKRQVGERNCLKNIATSWSLLKGRKRNGGALKSAKVSMLEESSVKNMLSRGKKLRQETIAIFIAGWPVWLLEDFLVPEDFLQ